MGDDTQIVVNRSGHSYKRSTSVKTEKNGEDSVK
jgi:hypothetical protein